MKKLTTLIIVIAAVAVSLYICKDKIWPKPKEVQHIVSKERVAKLYKIGKVSNASTMTYPGVVKSLKHAELFFRVSGPVKENSSLYSRFYTELITEFMNELTEEEQQTFVRLLGRLHKKINS